MMKQALIAVCVCFLCSGETPSDLSKYESFFQLLVELQHRPASFIPNVQEEIGLTALETKLLTDTAADYVSRMNRMVFEARLQAAESGKPSESEEQRLQLIRHHVDQLKAGFSSSHLQVLDNYVRSSRPDTELRLFGLLPARKKQ
jgi:hypothetical protein